jgi:mRNA interferase RelE/StbE
VKPYRVELTRAAKKELDILPRKTIDRILPALRELRVDPRPRGCKKLAGMKNTFRIRVGDYRVVYEVHEDSVLVMVIRVRHRKDAYE